LQQAISYKDQYLDGLKKTLNGGNTTTTDTTTLKVPKAETSND